MPKRPIAYVLPAWLLKDCESRRFSLVVSRSMRAKLTRLVETLRRQRKQGKRI